MAQVAYLDNLLKEYLVFRGFSNTLKTLDNEQKNEKDQSFRAEKLLEHFNQSINTQDLQSLKALWTHLDINLFSKLEHSYAVAVKKLENSLLKLYLITAYNNNKTEKISEFFTKLAPELHQQSEWKDWFYFPFCKNAEESPTFSHYFTKQWQDTLQISLRNFLTTVYQCIPQPTFVRAEHEAALIRRLQDENASLKTKLQALQQQQQQLVASSSTQNLHIAGSGDANSRRRSVNKAQQSLCDITPFDISPPGHIVDDFYIIATETNTVAQASDAQARGLKLLIRNIGSGNSPVMVRKDAAGGADKSTKRRSGSVGRSWI